MKGRDLGANLAQNTSRFPSRHGSVEVRVVMSNDQPEDIDTDALPLVRAEDDAAAVDLAFLDLDATDVVDLDALFDALNIAANETTTAIDFIQNDADRGGRLIVSDADLGVGGGAEDVSAVADMLFKSNIAADES